jgi:hypothetical protein
LRVYISESRKRLERESLAADLTCYQRTKPGERTQNPAESTFTRSPAELALP